MIITIREAVQRVQSLYSKGVQSSDTRLVSRHIYSVLLTSRSTVLKQQYDKGQLINQWMYQTIPCIELMKAPVYECPCVPKVGGCVILKSKFKIPKPIAGIKDHIIQGVTSLDGSLNFDYLSFEDQKYSDGNKFTPNKPTYYIRNEYLYISIIKELKAISITGLFDDPLEATQFQGVCGVCEECECKDVFDYLFPIDRDSFRTVLELCNKELIVIFPQLGMDTKNNATDDTGQKTMIHQ